MGNRFSRRFSQQQHNDGATPKFRGGSLVSSLRRGASLRRMSWLPRPHMEISTWLTAIDLSQYIDNFQKFGGVEDVLYYDEASIKDLGVRHAGHRAKMMSSLQVLRNKYEKNHKLKGVDPNPRLSLVEERRNNNLKLQILPDPIQHPDVILRAGLGTHRRNTRWGKLLYLPAIYDMSFEFDNNTGEVSADAEELRKLLEWELSLDAGDLRSHAWYHGTIPRVRAEEVVTINGGFLIRDCISQPGDYVLTCHWLGQTLHFVIQKTIVQPNTVYERIQYQLEDDAYDTIPDLVRSYVGGKRPITVSSGARIQTPVNRTAPLSFYASKYAAETAHTKAHGTLSRPPNTRLSEARPLQPHSGQLRQQHSYSGPLGVSCAVVRSPAHSPPRMRRDTAPTLPFKTQHGMIKDDRSNSSDGVIGPRPVSDISRFTTHSLPRKITSKSLSLSSEPMPTLQAEPETPDGKEIRPEELIQSPLPPPKPSRVPSIKIKPKKPPQVKPHNPHERIYAEIEEDDEEDLKKIEDLKTPTEAMLDEDKSLDEGNTEDSMSNPRHSRLSEMYQPSGSDSGNGSGDSVQTSASDTRNRDSQASFGDSSSVQLEEDSVAEEEAILFNLPDTSPESAFDLENFHTLLLPSVENKPLDATALKGIKNIIIESGSRSIAAHLTKADLDVLNGQENQDMGLGVTSGIELVTLPHGTQLRSDLIERTESMKLLVAVTVLMCSELNERAEIIHKWIQVAIDTKTAMGNLYGFCGIMLGLCNPEIQRLTTTWHTVRQKYTDSAFNFESKLRSTLKAMNECTNPLAPNTTIPHLLPFVLLCERDLDDIYSMHKFGGSLLQWESTAADYGIQMLLTHLQEARALTENLGLYRRNAEHILPDPNSIDDLTIDMFRSEFHLKFLWGSKGAFADSEERHAKFGKIVSTLSERCEPLIS
ncbi:unnamed protein product, partial [Meganyctiphanes norvegica]